MIENILLILFGIGIISLGITNVKGNIPSIHWYNRKKVTPENAGKYGKIMGIGTIIIGIAIVITQVILLIFPLSAVWSIVAAVICAISCLVGITLMIYAQFKYNKGIF